MDGLTKGSWIASYLVVGTRALQKRAHELGAIASVLLAYRNFFKEKYISIPEFFLKKNILAYPNHKQ